MDYVKHLNLFGIEAKEIPCITASGAPTTETEGAVGLLYMNTDNGDLYKCTAAADSVYTWVALVETGGSDSEYTQPEWGAKETGTVTEVALELSYDGDMLSAPVEAEVADMILAGLADVECTYSDGTTFEISDIDYDGECLKVPNPGDPDTAAYINGTINNTATEIKKIPAEYLETDTAALSAKINSLIQQQPLHVTFTANAETGECTCDTEYDTIWSVWKDVPIIAFLDYTDYYISVEQTATVHFDYDESFTFKFPILGKSISFRGSTPSIADLT